MDKYRSKHGMVLRDHTGKMSHSDKNWDFKGYKIQHALLITVYLENCH
jgi:hypothetical protein